MNPSRDRQGAGHAACENCRRGPLAYARGSDSSPFRELEPFAGAFLAVLLAFLDAGVAGEQPELLELGAKLRVGSDQSAGHAELRRPRLPVDAAALHGDEYVKPV